MLEAPFRDNGVHMTFAEEEPVKKGYEGIAISACMLLTALVLIAIIKFLF
jgi:hypothetical protein